MSNADDSDNAETPENSTDLEEDTNETQTDIFASSSTWMVSEEKGLQEEMFKIQNLDIAIREIDVKMKEAADETLSCQCQNREELKALLSMSAAETGRLSENTKQFFQLCPKYKDIIGGDTHRGIKEKNTPRPCIYPKYRKKHANTPLRRPNDRQLDQILQCNTRLAGNNKTETRATNLTDKLAEFSTDYNPYSIDAQSKKLLFELNEKLLRLRQKSQDDVSKNLVLDNDNDMLRSLSKMTVSNSDDKFAEERAAEPRADAPSPLFDTASTISTLRNVDQEIVDEVLNECASSIS